MIAQLLKEKENEIKHEGFCVGEFNINQLQTEEGAWKGGIDRANVEELETTIKQITEAIKTLKADIPEMQVQLKRSVEDREH